MKYGNGHGKVPSPISAKMYWLDINYLVLRSNLLAGLTSKSIGDPKACKEKHDPVDE